MSLLRRHRDFRLLWIGETVSRFGSAVTTVALPLLAISALEATSFEVGLLTAAAWFPWLLIGLPAGAWVDRLPHRPMMLTASAASFLLLASVPVVVAFDALTIHLLLVLAVLTGMAAVFFQTAYTAYLPTLLESADHAEGNAKLHGSAAAAQIAGLGCGGLVVQFAGPVNALLVDALTFLLALACLAAIRFRERPPTGEQRSGIRAGLDLVAKDVWLRTLTVFGAVSNLALMGYQSIVVVFLVREVGLTPGAVGGLVAAAAGGGVVGAFAGRRLAARFGTARAMLLCELGLPSLALLIPLSTTSPVFYLVGAFGVGVGVVGGNVIKATFQQSYCPPDLLGRLTATSSFVNYGTIPLGALLGGTLGELLGLGPALWITTAGVPLAGLVLLLSPIRGRRDLPTHQLGGAEDHQGSKAESVSTDSSRVRTD
ncbi:putative MFS family arabinose efflux permease [Kribbella amoyensis]|uniref:Putative MFS family arabinose efflux permease n=1 Tax=Kribbella amoyensis TaxID=996641 RepID=A0A561BVS7_9ACTN|nr:MFS transporter [Kribbella amoyensis]TWD83005.1 putative MFS family arabinose efflux permease [Kribbella amoyensis]